MITRLRYPKGYQFFDANGVPLALGTLGYYVAGTTTPQDTYADSAGAAANSNPIVLDGSGRLDVDVYLGPTANYKEVLTSASVTISPWPDDNIPPATQTDWNAASGPNQILNKPVLAAVATSGSFADLSSKPSAFTGDGGSGGASGFVPAPAAGDAVANKFLSASGAWVTPPSASGSASTNLSIAQTSTSVGIGSSSGTGITIPEATPAAAGVLDASRAAKIDGLAAVATSGSYTDLANKPSIPSIPSSLSGQDIDNVARLGINTIDTSNGLSANTPSVLFANAGDMRTSISKGASSNVAAVNLQDNYSTRVQFGLIGNDDFTISTSADGSTFKNAIVATTAGAVSFPNTGGFTGDSGSGGTAGLVPAPSAGTAAAGKYLKADGAWSVPPGAATVMSGATSSTAGASGLVPAPSSGQQGAFLRGDGTWEPMTAVQIGGLAPSATVDTTNATNVTAGTLPASRLPDLSGTYLAVATAGANNGVATLDAGGKLTASQIPTSLTGAVVYQGTWNASTNTPTLASGVGTKGYYYKVSVAGTPAIDGISQWNVGDTIIFDGTIWDKIDGISNEVVSVAGLYGTIAASGLKSALAISSGDVSGLGSLATQNTVNLASQAVSGSYPVALNASGNTSLTLPASGTLATTAQLTAGNISGLAASATADTTNASNITSGTLPAARLPNPSASSPGGVQSATASANQFMTGISTAGVPQFAQPSAANVSGLAAVATSGSFADLTNKPIITSLTTYNIKPDGTGDFATIQAALDAISNNIINQRTGVNFSLADGVYNHTAPLMVFSNVFARCTILGNSYSKTMSSVVSSSGGVGAWTYTLQLNNVTGLTVGMYVVVSGLSGGTNPTYLAGMWPITSVNFGSNQITITTTHHLAQAASGAVAGTVCGLGATLKFNGGINGLEIYDGAAVINFGGGTAFVGDNTGNTYGLDIEDNGRIYCSGTVGVTGFTQAGVVMVYSSEFVNNGLLAVSASSALSTYQGLLIATNSTFDSKVVISGNYHGCVATTGGVITLQPGCIVTGNGEKGLYSYNQGYIGGTATLSGNNYGAYMQWDGFIDVTNLTFVNNTTLTYQSGVGFSKAFATVGVAPAGTTSALNMGIWGSAHLRADGTGKAISRLSFGTDNSGYSFSIAKAYGGTLTDIVTFFDNGCSGVNLAGATPAVPWDVNGAIRTRGVTVASLPAAGTAGAGARHTVTDSTVAASGNFGATVAGSGSYIVPVFSNGTNWLIG